MPFPEDLTEPPVLLPDVPEEGEAPIKDGTADSEKQAEQAETDAALDKELDATFPTSDPSSSWAGRDIEPERPESDEPSESLIEGISAPQPDE